MEGKKLIRRLFCALTALAVLLAGGALAEDNENRPQEALVRLHVIAEDDSPEAQALKLQVRDAVLEAAQVLLAGCETPEQAWRRLNESREAFGAVAEARARRCGYEGAVAAQTGVFAFPDRTYGDTTVPAGDYRALRIVIGPGEGRNWWCVLYPTLCLSAEDGYYSILGQWFERWFGGDSE